MVVSDDNAYEFFVLIFINLLTIIFKYVLHA
jgi:hypothetical protein